MLNIEFYAIKNGQFIKQADSDNKKNDRLNGKTINLMIPVRDKNESIGALQVQFASKRVDFVSIIQISILIMLISIYISKNLTDTILGPLFSLFNVTQKIKTDNDYSLRAKKYSPDEIGSLVDSFNYMLDSIQAHDARQTLFHNHVTKMAAFMKNITDKNDYYLRIEQENKTEDAIIILTNAFNTMLEKIQQYQKQFSLAERQAGMSDVETSILHNIGNVLNSVNISIDMIQEKVMQSKLTQLSQLSDLLKQHRNHLAQYLTEDPKGKSMIDYLSLLNAHWEHEKNDVQKEINELKKNISVITNIIHTQNISYKTMDVAEKVSLTEIIEDSLLLLKNEATTNIEIIRDFRFTHSLIIDRIKLLQIIMNLIKNSIQSLNNADNEKKQIMITTQEKDRHHVLILIKDNGLGIAADNIDKIFHQGFTTKDDGHGYGLHWCALAAKELGGKLSVVTSELNKGATFTLELLANSSSSHSESRLT